MRSPPSTVPPAPDTPDEIITVQALVIPHFARECHAGRLSVRRGHSKRLRAVVPLSIDGFVEFSGLLSPARARITRCCCTIMGLPRAKAERPLQPKRLSERRGAP